MKLVIAEKPSVAQTIAAVLGAKEKKRWISHRKRLYRFLVCGTFGKDFPKLPPTGNSLKNESYERLTDFAAGMEVHRCF